MRPGRISEAWKYFKIDSEQNRTAICLLCTLKLSFRSTVSNLKKHLRTKHRGVLPPRQNLTTFGPPKVKREYKTFTNSSPVSEPGSPKSTHDGDYEQAKQSSVFGSGDTNLNRPLERRYHEEYEASEVPEPTIRKVFQPRFALSWDSYQNRLCSKLNTLLKSEDFVDLTLAADGHLVRVHQLIMSIASPYLKEIIRSSPARHPIIFLTNVSYATLGHLLQYVYTGEVDITEEELEPFFAAAKALQIQGIDSEIDTDVLKSAAGDQLAEAVKLTPVSIEKAVGGDHHGSQNIITLRSAKTKTSNAPDTERFIPKRQSTRPTLQTLAEEAASEDLGDVMMDEDMVIVPTEDLPYMVDPIAFYEVSRNDDPDPVKSPDPDTVETLDPEPVKTPPRKHAGSVVVQTMILNRYKYTLTKTLLGGMKKWRCIDRLKHGCTVTTVTNGSAVVQKPQPHNHPFHDQK